MIEWVDRNWNLLFHKEQCLRIFVYREKYGELYERKTHSTGIVRRYRCLGKGWYKIIRE
jgi:hypothetical protein